MEIYVLNMLSLLIWGVIYKKIRDKRKARIFVCTGIALQFSIMQGLRSFNVGIDTPVYVDKYISIMENERLTLTHYLTGNIDIFEPGFKILIYVLGRLGFSAHGFLFVMALIINGFLARFIYRDSKDVILSFWLFIGMEYFTLSFTTLRQMVATVFLLNAYLHLKDDEYGKSFLYLILAISFHKTAFIFIILPIAKLFYRMLGENNRFLRFLLVNKYICIFVILCTIQILKSIVLFVGKMLYGYESYIVGADLGMLFIIMMGILIFTLYADKFCDDKSKLRYYQFFALVTVCLQYCTTFVALISRVSLYFYIFSIVSIPFVIYYIKDVRYRRIIIAVVMAAFFMQYLLTGIDIYNLVPYTIL